MKKEKSYQPAFVLHSHFMQLVKQKFWLCLFFLFCVCVHVKAQDTLPVREPVVDSLSQQKDLMDVIKKIFPPKKVDTTKKKSNITVLPAIGYNPSIGFLLGINFLRTFNKGDPLTTKLSVAQLDFSVTT